MLDKEEMVALYVDANYKASETKYVISLLMRQYKENYDLLTWEERRPDIIKKLIEATRHIITARFLLYECIVEEDEIERNTCLQEKD